MYREILWTEESEDHIARHDVRPHEVQEAVSSRPTYVATGREHTTLVYGTTNQGRRLLVVLTEAMDGRWYVITARDMTDTEARAFRKKSQ